MNAHFLNQLGEYNVFEAGVQLSNCLLAIFDHSNLRVRMFSDGPNQVAELGIYFLDNDFAVCVDFPFSVVLTTDCEAGKKLEILS